MVNKYTNKKNKPWCQWDDTENSIRTFDQLQRINVASEKLGALAKMLSRDAIKIMKEVKEQLRFRSTGFMDVINHLEKYDK